MTRREEIIAEAKKHEYDWGVDVDRFDVPDIFAKGAEWMQEMMIEKVEQWLTNSGRGQMIGSFHRFLEKE